MLQFSRDMLSPARRSEALPIKLWGEYQDRKLDLAIVCLEVAVSVDFADRIRKRTKSVLRRWERLHWDAVGTANANSAEITLGHEAISIVEEMELDIWRKQFPNGMPWGEYPKDSMNGRAAALQVQLRETGRYLMQAAAALSARFNMPKITAEQAEAVSTGASGRPLDPRVTELVETFNRVKRDNPKAGRKDAVEAFNRGKQPDEHATVNEMKNACDSRNRAKK